MGSAKKTDKVFTLEEFMTKAIKKYENRLKVVNIEFDDGLIPFSRPTEDELLRYIDGISQAIKVDGEGNYQGQDTTSMFEISRDFVFSCCKFVQNKELQQSFEVVEPSDVVVKIFGIEGTIEIATKIKEAFDGDGIKEQVDSTIKN